MQDITLAGLLKQSFDYQVDNMFTAIPCVVVRTDLINCMVDVQPSITRLMPDNTSQTMPVILAVPLMFQSSNTTAITFPVNVGDTVLCVFSMKGLDNFKQSEDGTPTRPTDFRKFDKRDAIAIPGLAPFSRSVNRPQNRTLQHNVNDAVITHNIGKSSEVEIRFKPNGDLVVNSPTNVTVNCSTANLNANTLTANVGNTVWNGNYTINGTLTLDGVVVNGHDHPISGGSSAPGPTGPMQ